MKHLLTILSLGFTLSLQLAFSTPDRQIKITERIIGSNPDHFIILRTEVDNHGSYYKSQTKQYLDTYTKLPAEANPRIDSCLAKKINSSLFVVITENSSTHIKRGSFLTLKNVLSVDLSIESSSGFQKKWPIR